MTTNDQITLDCDSNGLSGKTRPISGSPSRLAREEAEGEQFLGDDGRQIVMFAQRGCGRHCRSNSAEAIAAETFRCSCVRRCLRVAGRATGKLRFRWCVGGPQLEFL